MTPLGPHDIPDDTGVAGLVGWIGESVARSLMLRLAALVSLVGVLGGLSDDAPAWTRVAAVVVGLSAALALLFSQLLAWPRARQWVLIVGVLAITVPLLAFHVSRR